VRERAEADEAERLRQEAQANAEKERAEAEEAERLRQEAQANADKERREADEAAVAAKKAKEVEAMAKQALGTETPHSGTNKNKKMLNDDAMAGMLLSEPATNAKNKKGGKGNASKASGQTDTCGCTIF